MHLDPIWIILSLAISLRSYRLLLAAVDRLDDGSCLVPRGLKSRLKPIPVHSREETRTFDAAQSWSQGWVPLEDCLEHLCAGRVKIPGPIDVDARNIFERLLN